MTRRLVLAKETLTDLTDRELGSLAGAAPAGDSIAPTCFTGLTVCGVCERIPTHHYRGVAAC